MNIIYMCIYICIPGPQWVNCSYYSSYKYSRVMSHFIVLLARLSYQSYKMMLSKVCVSWFYCFSCVAAMSEGRQTSYFTSQSVLCLSMCWSPQQTKQEGPLLLTWINFDPRMVNYINYKVWYETIEVWEWISHFIIHFTGHVSTYPCWD